MRNKKLQSTVLSCFAVLMMSSMATTPVKAAENPQKTLQTTIDLSKENSELSKLKVSAKKQETKISILQKNIDTLAEKVNIQEEKVSTLKDNTEKTKKTLKKSQNKKATIEAGLEQKEETLKNLEKSYDKNVTLEKKIEITRTRQEISKLEEKKNEVKTEIKTNESIYKVYEIKHNNTKDTLKDTHKEKSNSEETLKEEFSKKEEIDNNKNSIETEIDNAMGLVIVNSQKLGPVENKIEVPDINYIKKVNEERRIEAERLAEEARIKAEQEAAERARIEAERQAAIRARGQAIVDAAMSKRGTPYVWGAAGPNSFDCSGLVYWACKQAGVYFERTTAAQLATMGQEVSINELQPGDIITLNTMGYISHVVIYIGNGQIVHAPQTGDVIKTGSLSRYPSSKIVNCRRLYV